jgi:hypothetical protein
MMLTISFLSILFVIIIIITIIILLLFQIGRLEGDVCPKLRLPNSIIRRPNRAGLESVDDGYVRLV